MKKVLVALILFILALGTLVSLPSYYFLKTEYTKLESDDPEVWEDDIRQFEENEKHDNLPDNAVLFVGSSSIRFWNELDQDFYPIPVIKRGFGGAKLRDIIYYADRIILKHKPRVIVLFAGTNDICGKENDKTPVQLFNDFKTFAEIIRKNLPITRLIYLPITPTVSRWEVWPEASKANKLISEYIKDQPNMIFLETDTIFLDQNGLPKEDLFWWDGVHLNEKGYEQWKNLIYPELAGLYSNYYSH